jgi:hypothetical protein
MKKVRSQVSAWLVALTVGISAPAAAQEITDAHLRAAWAAVLAVGADEGFDDALPNIAEQVQGLILQRRPDLFRQVGEVVNQVALSLVVRRLDLNNDVARVWAQMFTEAELNEITAFYTGPTGRKFAELFGDLTDATLQAFEGWYERLATEMYERTLLEFERQGITF